MRFEPRIFLNHFYISVILSFNIPVKFILMKKECNPDNGLTQRGGRSLFKSGFTENIATIIIKNIVDFRHELGYLWKANITWTTSTLPSTPKTARDLHRQIYLKQQYFSIHDWTSPPSINKFNDADRKSRNAMLKPSHKWFLLWLLCGKPIQKFKMGIPQNTLYTLYIYTSKWRTFHLKVLLSWVRQSLTLHHLVMRGYRRKGCKTSNTYIDKHDLQSYKWCNSNVFVPLTYTIHRVCLNIWWRIPASITCIVVGRVYNLRD